MSEAVIVTAEEGDAVADAKRFRVVAIVAGVVAIPFVLAHLMIGFAMASFQTMYADMGGEITGLAGVLIGLGSSGVLALLLLGIDIAVFVGMYRLAKRYWIGLLFAPVFIYLAISALLVPAMYLPLFQVISVVE
ncbi:MAG: hypothetical protein Q7V14_04970 [Coriobacteriia bacterium]|nr:hypothetical protein [Coriobacteriia bacterium]